MGLGAGRACVHPVGSLLAMGFWADCLTSPFMGASPQNCHNKTNNSSCVFSGPLGGLRCCV